MNPQLYHRYLGPLQFAPYARLLSSRAHKHAPRRVLETAAGTGILTEALQQALPQAQIVATDRDQAMLDAAALRLQSSTIRFQLADAQKLPFGDGTFDLVACQFGVMFFSDKVAANAEAHRVLRQGGVYMLAAWDSIEQNLASKIASEAVADLYPILSDRLLRRAAYAYHDCSEIEHDLLSAGFDSVVVETVQRTSRLGSAREAAIGFCQGSAIRLDIEEQGADALERATQAAATALARFENSGSFEAPMSAHIAVAGRGP